MADATFDEGEVWGEEEPQPRTNWWPMLATAGAILAAAGLGVWGWWGAAARETPQEPSAWALNLPPWKGIEATPARAALPEPDPLAEFLAQYQKDQEAERLRFAQLQRELEALKHQKPAVAPAPAEKAKPRPHRSMGSLVFQPPEEKTAPALPEYALAPGDTIIPCDVLTAMHSDVESNATAKVTVNVYDTNTRRRLLVPQGSTVLVRYHSAQLVFGNERLPATSNLLTLPSGKTMELNDEPLMDGIGQAGVVTDINRHYWRALGAVIIQGVLRGSVNSVTYSNPYATGLAQSANQFGTQITNKFIDLRPTITVSAGEPCTLVLTRAITLPEYREIAQR